MRKENDVIDVSITPEVLAEDRMIIKMEIDNFLREKMISFEEAIDIIEELSRDYHHPLFSFRMKK